MAFALTAVDPATIFENGGYLFQVQGTTFTADHRYHVHIGPLGSELDPICYSGVPEQGGVIYPWTATKLRVYSPLLDPAGGPYDVFVVDIDTEGTDGTNLAGAYQWPGGSAASQVVPVNDTSDVVVGNFIGFRTDYQLWEIDLIVANTSVRLKNPDGLAFPTDAGVGTSYKAETHTLVTVMTVVYRDFRSTVFSMRRVLPKHWRTGPRDIDLVPPT